MEVIVASEHQTHVITKLKYSLEPHAHWRSGKLVKGEGRAEGAKNSLGLFTYLNPLKTYFLIKFGPFWTRSNKISPSFWKFFYKI